MSCDLKGGPDLVFPVSGLSYKIKDLSTRSARSIYDHARIRLDREDGEEIHQTVDDWEPALIEFDGVVENRYAYRKGSIKTTRKSARLTIYEARKVLDQGVLTNQYDTVTVSEVMDFAIDNRKDPYNIITGWEAAGESGSQTVESIDSIGLIGTLGGIASEFLAALGLMREAEFRGIEIEDETPSQVIARIENMFGLTTWVETDGTFVIGQPEAVPKNYHSVSGDPMDSSYAMKSYHVLEGSFPLTLVKLTGETHWFGGAGIDTTQLYPMAEASIVDSETREVKQGSNFVPEEPVNIFELESLETAAKNILISELMKYESGTVVFNGAASDEKAKLANMSFGDMIYVDPQISDYCKTVADGGLYTVTEVQHKVSTRQGWKITAEVALIPRPDEIETTAFYYNPEDDEAYTEMPSYQNN